VALLGREVDQGMAVALHAGTAVALLDLVRWRPAVLIPAGLVSVAAAVTAGDAAARSLRSRRATGLGMLAGAAALALADRAPSRTREPGLADGLALGIAQALALWPGVSRNGATLAAARARGFDAGAANRLSFEVGVPTLIGAAAHKARAVRPTGAHLAGAAAAFASTLASRPLLRAVTAGRPLWPFAAYRAGIGLALVRGSGR
jgi:undecaprenyl-diphosphatase